MAILVHASGDAFPNAILGPLFPASVALTNNGINVGYCGFVIGYGVLTLFIVTLTKGSLSYEHYRAQQHSSSRYGS
jgi:hypothetical protein